MASVKKWIEKEINNEHIRYFEYNKFSQIIEIGSGAFGKVSRANFVETGLVVALKILFNKSSKEINEDNDELVNEVKLLREVDYHENINRILGITKDSENYVLVLEYANEGNLRDYLKKRFDSLEWNDKIRMALDITNGLRFLHSKEIIHRDLHSKNILVNNRKLLIADLGLSKKLKDSNPLGNGKGVIEYTEPQLLKNIKYKKDKKSDIYSLGVLLWEISSGRPPFSNYSHDNTLALRISHENLREDPIEGTPPNYQELYQKCWDDKPETRPNIKEVYEILIRLNPKDPFDTQYPPPNTRDSNPDIDRFYISSNYLKPRNLLIVGRALTLSNKKNFVWNGSIYNVIEIVFESIEKKVYDEMRHLMPEGISQILFVVDKSFTTEEKAMFKLFKQVIFESGILKYVTIVKNEFDNFKNVLEENDIIAEIAKSCNDTICIKNPPIFTCDEDENIVNRDARKRSRDILLNYLEKECQEEYYKLEKCDDLFSKIVVEKANTTKIADLQSPHLSIDDNGLRVKDSRKKEPIEGSSQEYQNGEPKSSPDIEDKHKLEKNYKSISKSSERTTDINKKLSVDLDINVKPESNSSSQYQTSVVQSKMSDGKQKISKEQEKFNTQYSNEKEIVIDGSKSIISFLKFEFTKLEFEFKNLEGFLKIEGFNNLEIISLKDLKLNSLKINNCSQLNKVDLSELTELTSLSVRDCPKLTTDGCSLTKLISLKSLKISNCSQFKKIFNLSVFPRLECLSIIECSNLTMFDCSPSGLTYLEISDCSQLNQITGFFKFPKLTSLSIRKCPKLTKLDCSSTKRLAELEVSDLGELNCSNTKIEELSLNLCPNIKKLICLNNKKLNKLDLSNCSNLDFLDCTGSKLTSLDLSYCPKSIEVETSDQKQHLIITRKIENFRNILMVGRTGGSKSTLVNVLTDTRNFKESAYTVSQTKSFNKIDFEWNAKNFRVVDTIAVGGSKLSTENILFKIAEGILSMPEGISHVLYVIDGRFTGDEINTFNMIKDSIFKSGILDYITIVRTKFSNFRDKGECEKDVKQMREENKLVAEIVDSCNGVIHVDIPDIAKKDDDDDYVNNARKMSRKKVLDYLEEKYKDEYFKSENWDVLCNKIVEYIRNYNLQELEIDPDILKLSERGFFLKNNI
uniref:Protein kinase domain-containing protein n=1 Tax=Rhizophagus irregularis (strain DAOM 181602 / DAOM 197198 / MUCL 43194) TaxID=747089 RepID=U9UDK4_RHIID